MMKTWWQFEDNQRCRPLHFDSASSRLRSQLSQIVTFQVNVTRVNFVYFFSLNPTSKFGIFLLYLLLLRMTEFF